MLPFGVNPVGVLMAAVATFAIGMVWYSPLLFAKPWVALNGYTPEKLAEMKKGAARMYGISFLAYLVLGIGIACHRARRLGPRRPLGRRAPLGVHRHAGQPDRPGLFRPALRRLAD